MENGADVAVGQDVFAHLADKLVLVEIMQDVAVGQIAEFFGAAEIVHRHDVGNAALIQRFDNIAADKAGGAGYDNGHGLLPFYRGMRMPQAA